MKGAGRNAPHVNGEPAANAKAPRSNDPEQTRRDILTVATQEFADKGLSGARIDETRAHLESLERH